MIVLLRNLFTAAAMFTTLVGCAAAESSFTKENPGDAEFASGADRTPTPQTLLSLARILAAQGKDDSCAEVLIHILREYPRCLSAYVDLAQLHMRHHRPDDAVAVLQAGLEVAPGNATLLNDMGMCCLLQRQYEPAIELFIQAAAAGGDARPRGNLAVALGMLGRYEEALAVYSQIVPAGQAHYNLALLCQARNDHSRAQGEFRRAHRLDSTLQPPASAGS